MNADTSELDPAPSDKGAVRGRPAANCSPDLKFLAFRIERLTKWGNGFESFMDRHAPGFKQPHEARIYRHFWLEIDQQCEEIAHELGDREGHVLTFVHSGGFVQFRKGETLHTLNTPTRLVRFLAKSQEHPPR